MAKAKPAPSTDWDDPEMVDQPAETSTALATADAAPPINFRVKKNVTLPLFKLKRDKDYFFMFRGHMYVGKKLEEKKEAATLLEVADLVSGEEGIIICPVVLQKELLEAYPQEDYVGRCFKLRITRIPEKRYNLISLQEIEVE